MTESLLPKKFSESHPFPDKCGISSLFRFYKIDLDRVEHLEYLFIKRKLYHSLPSQFNDPFECKPHFNWPEDVNEIENLRQHLIKVAVEHGCDEKEAEEIVSKEMEDSENFQKIIFDTIHRIFAEVRICCFTSRKENLLFWSHYADAHKGFCVEFDATKGPISSAFKVQYVKEYPKVIYPPSNDASDLKPLLVKSEIWNYEEEFRSLLVSWAKIQPPNDGESLILNGDEIKNVYLGAQISKEHKVVILDLIKQGGFNPGIWATKLGKSTFSLEFERVG
ncbi:DUF2971 domain-containing protein [Nitrospina gracilis]|uniref:DUF2971 domain-containing protein n=1 Tax=Nitrospina gracilis TaxID=35801 RepID=UPI001F3BF4A2|nr:DUF2971 domain-containing protein [Nitrospina gracilis]MCF8719187.1 hypothetical protein [Nitrospina gracilis Nb-211]